ncbi:Polyribonucleotide nucleotidyltransferase [Chthoniobacter flavus Ellin428]|uniref:Polyribonucleotide nucleotidyltransferase n=1 Tax=Chthoniobacter flavus Ellin428 TaxID=497964 RepID=B4D3R8_9BACT|nr:polyribonucleotide nucleotidyltransferase [Chthoniobacter flavus]EDY18898.1 Polyribonucleotide nucleotidyltransferase [Chthoniobacter flavus Ellin428]TCO93488.1 polyribonucleotide nucleotidyltransferase [Chthoniobacter flavus]
MSIHNVTAHIGAHPITIETGKLAKLADGAVTVRSGETIVFISAVSATTVKEGQDFFPLTVDYREKAAAVGKFPGGYFKREGRPSEKEILTCRMTDRPLRPLFPKGYLYDTQIIGVLLSADGEVDPDILFINGASAALMVSDIPFAGPVGAVRVGRVNGQFIANPTHSQMADSDLDLVYVGNATDVIMIEGAGDEVPEEQFIAALHFAQTEVSKIVALQQELAQKVGKAKRQAALFTVKDELMEVAYAVAGDRIEAAIYNKSKVARQKAIAALKDEVSAAIIAKYPEATKFEISQAFDYLQKKAFRVSILDKQTRCDGRGLDQIRDLSAEVGLLPRSHGSALFQRGETQAVALATLAPADEAQELDGYTGGETTKRFILHYNFPPFSVGETGRTGSPGRREIGHGALAERSVEPVIPDVTKFPYAIRVSSEVMESNGSTSMASVCSGVLALLDAGVPLKKSVAGISCGLVTEFRADGQLDRYTMLTDIIGSEDHFGDMDWKLCGTRDGVTGFQLDLKLPGIPLKMMEEAIYRTRDARMRVLDVMDSALSQPRTELSKYAPRIETIRINPDKIGLIIGPGGKTIKGIVAETGAEINIEDDGSVHIYSNNGDSLLRAKQIIEGMTKEISVGEMYQGRVVTIKEFGCFVEVLPGKDGMVHISELADFRVNRVEDVVKMGDVIWVKCIGVDEKGRVKLSRKAAMKERGEAAAAAPAAPVNS